jgi:uncharacterized protein
VASKTCLVTGASTGIGYEFTKLFARQGYALVMVARDHQALQRVAEELTRDYNISVRLIRKDLSLPGSATDIFDELHRQSIHVDVLINNAGFGTYGPFGETDLQTEVAMMQLNIVALTELTKLFLLEMLAKGEGKILNVASTAAFQPVPLMAVYYATKAYVLSFSEALARELNGSGVTVSVLCPGPTRTEFQRRVGIKGTKLFDALSMDAATVAKVGYQGLMKGRTVVIPGLMNRLIASGIRFVPRSLVTGVLRKVQKGRAKT